MIFSIEYARAHPMRINWFQLSKDDKLSEEFIKEFQFYLNWVNISQYQRLSYDFIYEFKNHIIVCDNIKQCIKNNQATKTLQLVIPYEVATLIGSFM